MKTIPPPCPEPESGPKYWRSLDQLADRPEGRSACSSTCWFISRAMSFIEAPSKPSARKTLRAPSMIWRALALSSGPEASSSPRSVSEA